MDLDRGLLEQTLRALGDVLEARALHYDLAVVGGSALMLLDLGVRPTKDLDVVARIENRLYLKVDPLPEPLAEAISQVASTYGLPSDWVNPGPTSLLDLGLPQGFAERTEIRSFGGLVLHVASRKDQIHLKFYAATDLGPDSKHVEDLRRLSRNENELVEAARWAMTHDPSSGFRRQSLRALEYFGVTDADAKL